MFAVMAGFGLFLIKQTSHVVNLTDIEATPISSSLTKTVALLDNDADIESQAPLANPPAVIKAIYATNWSVANEKKLNYLINLIKTTELNALVIDIKDFSGYISYNTNLELPKKYNAVELRIPKLNRLIKRLHDEGIYLIGRIAVFQDQRLPLARPDLALHASSTKGLWHDRKGLMWLDTAAQEVWDYNISVAKEILARGFDEVNFDYVRFASDGNMSDVTYPYWDGRMPRSKVVSNFFKYIRESLPDSKLSVDIFGLVTIAADDLGIGQYFEDALPYFDAIAPMVYPSHYSKGFNGYQNPADHPYEVVKYSLDFAVRRMKDFMLYASTTPMQVKLRPWLQDFDLGANYDAAKVRAEIQAVIDSASSSPELFDGWMLWDPNNVYTSGALIEERHNLIKQTN